MAAWFVLTVPTAAYEQKLLADRDRNADGNKVLPLAQGENLKGFLSLGPVQGSTLLQNRRLETGLSSLVASEAIGPLDESSRSNLTSISSILTRTLEELKVNDVVWSISSNDKYYQVTFPAGKNDTETILQQLRVIGIGTIYDTKVSVLPCSLQYNSQETSYADSKIDNSDADGHPSDADTDGEKATERGLLSKTSGTNKFIQSIKSRLAVAQVVEGVRESAVLSFDFIMFVLLAGMLAALGLVENSSVILVAAMLVSPMMGPILAGTFGTVIQDRNLQRLGVRTELIGLAICLSFGFVFGIIYSSVGSWGEGFWLKDEMVARGQLRSLWVGVLIALPSGAGVALSVLGGNVGSLVGVAISASLLPPVVNTGLLWATAMTKYVEFKITNNTSVLTAPDSYHSHYSDNMAEEALLLGAVSLCLTLLNIFCIVLMGIVVLKIKEVTPDKEAPNTRRFWNHDIREVRNYNRTIAGKEAKNLISQIHDEINAKLGREDAAANGSWQNCVQEIFSDPVYRTVRMKSVYISPEITQMTWHPIQRHSANTNSPNLIAKRSPKLAENQYQRSFSAPRDSSPQSDPNVKVKIGTVTREKPLLFTAAKNSHRQTPSPTRRITWNFPLQPNDRQGRFVISRADIPIGSLRNSKSRRGRRDECTTNLYDLHDLVP